MKVKEHSLRTRLLGGGLWAILARIGGIGFGIVSSMLLARMLTPEEMGTYFLALSVIGVASSIGQLGLVQVVVRLVAEAMAVDMLGRVRLVILRAMSLTLMGGTIVAVLFYSGIGDLLALHLFHSGGMRLVVGWMSVTIVFFGLQGVINETYRGFHDIRFASLFGSALTPAILVVLLILLWVSHGHASLQHIFILLVASSMIALLISAAPLRKRLVSLHGSGSASYNELLSIGWPLCLIQIAIFVATQADLWIVGAYLSQRDVAIYGSVQKLLMFITMTHSLVVAVAQSSVAELYAKGEKRRLEHIIQKMAFLACLPSGMLLVVYAVWGGDILQLVFGEFYREGYQLLLILCIGQFISMLLGPAGMMLMMTGCQKPLMWLIVVNGLIGILLAMLLVRNFGLPGVALAWGVGAVIQGVGAWWVGYRMIGVKTHAKFSSESLTWRNG